MKVRQGTSTVPNAVAQKRPWLLRPVIIVKDFKTAIETTRLAKPAIPANGKDKTKA